MEEGISTSSISETMSEVSNEALVENQPVEILTESKSAKSGTDVPIVSSPVTSHTARSLNSAATSVNSEANQVVGQVKETQKSVPDQTLPLPGNKNGPPNPLSAEKKTHGTLTVLYTSIDSKPPLIVNKAQLLTPKLGQDNSVGSGNLGLKKLDQKSPKIGHREISLQPEKSQLEEKVSKDELSSSSEGDKKDIEYCETQDKAECKDGDSLIVPLGLTKRPEAQPVETSEDKNKNNNNNNNNIIKADGRARDSSEALKDIEAHKSVAVVEGYKDTAESLKSESQLISESAILVKSRSTPLPEVNLNCKLSSPAATLKTPSSGDYHRGEKSLSELQTAPTAVGESNSALSQGRDSAMSVSGLSSTKQSQMSSVISPVTSHKSLVKRQDQHLTSSLIHTATTLIHGDDTDIRLSPVKEKDTGVNIYELSQSTSKPQMGNPSKSNRNKVQRNLSKTSAAEVGFKCQEKNSHQLKNFFMVTSDSQVSASPVPEQQGTTSRACELSFTTQESSLSLSVSSSAVKMSAPPVTHISISSGPRPHPRTKPVTHTVPATAALSQAVDEKMSGTVPKSTNKPSRSRGSRSRTPQPPVNVPEDEDEDSDFIPVGMLQLSTCKRPMEIVTLAQSEELKSTNGTSVPTMVQQNTELQAQQGETTTVQADHGQNQVEMEALNERLQEQLEQQFRQHQLQEQQQKEQPGKQLAPELRQHKPKQWKSDQEQKGAQLQQLAQNIKAQQQEALPSNSQHQLLLQLVQQAQQQQKQLLDQQQQRQLQKQEPSHQQTVTQPATTGIKNFPKNQGLIIHHQSSSKKVPALGHELSTQTSLRIQKPEGKRKEGLALSSSHSSKVQGGSGTFEQFQQEQQQPQRHLPERSFTSMDSFQRESDLAIHQPQTQVDTDRTQESTSSLTTSNIPKIAEQLLQQTRTEMMGQHGISEQGRQASKTEQLFLQSRMEQLLQQQTSTLRPDQAGSRPLTPNAGSAHQQHPEIARMLNSPVSPRQPSSPRQPGSPRQSISPRGTTSPHPSASVSPSQFVSPRQPKQSVSPRQSAHTKPPSSPLPVMSQQQPLRQAVSPQPRQTASPRQAISPWQPVSPALPPSTSPAQFASVGHTSVLPAQSSTAHSPANLQAKSGMGQKVEKPTPFPQVKQINLQNYPNTEVKHFSDPRNPVASDYGQQLVSAERIHRLTSGGHIVSQDGLEQAQMYGGSGEPASPLPLASDVDFSPSQSIPSNLPSLPGQVIHHRPAERRSIQSKVTVLARPHSATPAVQFPSPQVPSSTVSVPSVATGSTVWQQMPAREARFQPEVSDTQAQPSKAVGLFSSQPVDIHRLAKQHMQNVPQQAKSSEFGSLSQDNLKMDKRPTNPQLGAAEHKQGEIQGQHPSAEFSSQNAQSEKPTVEMQLYPSPAHFSQTYKTSAETKTLNSYPVTASHDKQFQSMSNLTEKETRLIQSLFANDHPADGERRVQNSTNLTTSAVSQNQPQLHTAFSTSTQMMEKTENSVRTFTSVSSYPEMRKNEGGLKVLSEIASERYVLAVAGKDEMGVPHSEQDTFKHIPDTTADMPKESEQIRETKLPENKAKSSNTGSKSEKRNSSKKKGNTSEKLADKKSVPESLLAGESETKVNKSDDRVAKETPVDSNETPRRVVRQRKPKKPFEQEDTPARRNPKSVNMNKKGTESSNGNKRQKSTNSAPEVSSSKKPAEKSQERKSKKETKEEAEKNAKQKRSVKTRSVVKVIENDEKKEEVKKVTDDEAVSEENDENSKEIDSSSRRLSRRLQVKEIERQENDKKAEGENKRRSERQTGRVDYKEEGQDFVDETPTRGTRSTSRVNASSSDGAINVTSSDDAPVSESSRGRVTTRSKKRKPENREDKEEKVSKNTPVKGDGKEEKQGPQDQKSSGNTSRSSTPKSATSASTENKGTMRNNSKSPAQTNSRNADSGKGNRNTASITPQRMSTRQATPAQETPDSGGSRNKRSLPTEFVDELPPWRKKAKKPNPTDSKSDHGIDNSKSAAGKMDLVSETSKNEAGAASTGGKRSSRQSSSPTAKGKNTKRSKSLPKRAAKEKGQNDPGKKEADSASADVKMSTSSITGTETKQPVAADSSDTDNAMETEKLEGKFDVMEDNKGKADMKSSNKCKNLSQTSVIRSTAALSDHASDVKGTPQITSSSSSSVTSVKELKSKTGDVARTKGVSETQSRTTAASERRKMVMYKLVPVLGEDMSDLEVSESLVPVSGYFVPGGNDNRILLPHNFMHGPVTTKMSSSITSSWPTSSVSSALATLGTLSSVSSQSLPASSVISAASLSGKTDSLSRLSGSKAAFIPPLTSGGMGTAGAYSPLKSALCSATVTALTSTSRWTLPAQVSAGATSSSSSWTSPHSYSVPTPPPSAGEPSVGELMQKKAWTPAPPGTSPSQYRPSPSWNATPPSVPSSSPLPSSSSSSAWNLSSSATMPLPSQQQQQHSAAPQQQQPWAAAATMPTALAQQSPLETSWRSSPSVTVAAVESWSREFLPGTVYSNPMNGDQRRGEPMEMGPASRMNTSSQPEPYVASQEPGMTSSSGYSVAGAQDTEYTDTRSESMIQGFLRQVSNNPGGFSQELAGFNLGQQDFAYLENRLRQALSPNTLFSAVAAYDDNSGQGAGVSQENSLQESINLVHTVNLDMEEGNLDNSANLDLSGLRNSSMSQMSASRGVDGGDRMGDERAQGSGDVDTSSNMDQSQHDITTPGDDSKGDGKKVIRERKHQYEIILSNGARKFKCRACGKCFGPATIYRHLRIHDPDYKVTCNLCGKQYTQKHSLLIHKRKFHGEETSSAGLVKSPTDEESTTTPELTPLLSPNESRSSSLNEGPALPTHSECGKSPSRSVKSTHEPLRSPPHSSSSFKSPSDSKRQRRASSTSDPLATSLDESELLKKQATQRQVEELRRMKAEKKLEAAKRKAAGRAAETALSSSDSSYSMMTPEASRSEVSQSADSSQTQPPIRKELEQQPVNYSTLGSMQLTDQAVSGMSESQVVPGAASLSDPRPAYMPSRNVSVSEHQGVARPQFHLNSPQPVMSTLPCFQADNIPKPIPTPTIGSSSHTDSEMAKTMLPQDQSTPKQAKKVRYNPIITDDGKFVCEICGNQLNSRNGYALHVRRHSKIKTRFCSYCEKGFHTSQELRSHERTHTGEKPYKCEICYMAFAHSGSFISHRKGHVKRGETTPFPIIDGQIQYPPTFKKQKPEGAENSVGSKKKKGKKKTSSSEGPEGFVLDNMDQTGQQASVIRRNSLDFHPGQQMDAGERSINLSDRRLSLNEQSLNANNFSSSMGSPSLSDQSAAGMRMTSRDMMSPDRSGDMYPMTNDGNGFSRGGAGVNYYGAAPGYSQTIPPREFMSPQHEPASPQDYYKQGKYYPRSASADPYARGAQNQGGSMPVNLAMEKNQRYNPGVIAQPYQDNVDGSADYYSSQQQQPPPQLDQGYQYGEPTQNMAVSYQNEDYANTVSQYKPDPSSSEIVKKLLQHYNVPSATYPEPVPVDYSHQMQEPPQYSRGGPEPTPPTYDNRSVAPTPVAPPPYSASVSSQHKHYYSSQPHGEDYDIPGPRPQDQPGPMQSPHPHQYREPPQQPQAMLMPEQQFQSLHAQPYMPEEGYGSEDKQVRYMSQGSSYSKGQFADPAVRSPNQAYPQQYEVTPQPQREYYPQALPKIESLAREATGTGGPTEALPKHQQ